MEEKAKVDEVIVDNAEETKVEEKIDYEKMYNDTLSTVDKLKLDNAGLDRKIGELSKAQKELLLKSETADETAKREAEERTALYEAKKTELATKETDLLSKENALNVKLKATELGISLDEVSKLKLNSIEQLEAFKELKESLITESVESTTAKLNKDLSSLNRDSYKGNRSTAKKNPAMDRAVNNF